MMQELFALFPLSLLLLLDLMSTRKSMEDTWIILAPILKALPLISVAPQLVIVLRSLSVWLLLDLGVLACIMVLFTLIWILLKHRACGLVSWGVIVRRGNPLSFMTVPPSDTINLLNVSNFEKL